MTSERRNLATGKSDLAAQRLMNAGMDASAALKPFGTIKKSVPAVMRVAISGMDSSLRLKAGGSCSASSGVMGLRDCTP